MVLDKLCLGSFFDGSWTSDIFTLGKVIYQHVSKSYFRVLGRSKIMGTLPRPHGPGALLSAI